jgi:hypothetical protein
MSVLATSRAADMPVMLNNLAPQMWWQKVGRHSVVIRVILPSLTVRPMKKSRPSSTPAVLQAEVAGM